MSPRADAIGPALAGRSGETQVLSTLLSRAAAGEARTLLIFGDAGVGKTALVQSVCAQVASSWLILAGSCLPLTSMTVPFLAIRSALRDARDLDISLPDLRFSPDQSSNAPIDFDAWLDDLCRERSVVLAIDDLQWADQSTLDVLMYVLAGSSHRRLAVVATIRSDDVGVDHPLQRWLADARRLPRVEQMTLGALDRAATADQIADLLGAPAHQSLVGDVFAHNLGNPYLNRLSVHGLTPDTRHLPDDLPADLKSAVLQSWQRLSVKARDVARVLAVAGHPLTKQDLRDVTGGTADVLPQLQEAVDEGNLEVVAGGAYWFHHPLGAEVLQQALDDQELRRWHAAFAEHEQRGLTDNTTPAAETLISVADHHYRAGHTAEAYQWALRASEAAGETGGRAEMLRLLQRAVALRSELPDAAESETDLLKRLMAAASKAGAHGEELDAVDHLLAGFDPGADPLLVAELLVRRGHLQFLIGRAFFPLDDIREAVELSATEPTSWQHAFALAELSHTENWHGMPEARIHAERALAVAHTAGNPRALSYALTAVAMVAVHDEHGQEGLAFARQALDGAVAAADYLAYVHATLWACNCQEIWSTSAYANQLRFGREQLTRLGAPHTYVAWLSADEASSWLAIGDWRECLDRLRVALGSDPGPAADVSARLTAARLAAWQGRSGEAQAHLDRVDEFVTEGSSFLNQPYDAVRAEVYLAAGDPKAAYDSAMVGIQSPGMPPTMCEWLLPLASRSLADQVQGIRDAGQDPSPLLKTLDDLRTRFPTTIRDVGPATTLWDLQLTALNDLYTAEVGRARRSQGNAAEWVVATEACRVAKLAWEEVYACWRATESLLLAGRRHRHQAAALLRRGLALADELGAAPVQTELQALASSARISIESVDGAPSRSAGPLGLPGLTTREREILAHVVAGRTYAEIARDLVISEKTVSSHISNLLRKTGTSSRVDLSRLAQRAAGGTASVIE